MKRISMRSFGRLVGVSEQAVVKGAETGRLRDSLGTDASGRRYIADRALAVKEWRTRGTSRATPPTLNRREGEELVHLALEYVLATIGREAVTGVGQDGATEFDPRRLRAILTVAREDATA